MPFLFNCQEDNPGIISEAVPIGIQDNAKFVLCLDTSDDNGSWEMTASKAKFYIIIRHDGGKVVKLEKVNTQASADVAVRRTYTFLLHVMS